MPTSLDLELADVHSGLSRCRPARVLTPQDSQAVARAVRRARRSGRPLSVLGAHHAMGGQPFLDGGTVLDMGRLDRLRRFDAERGLVEVEAGALWPGLVAELLALQGPNARWGIRQKQTGADHLTVGGAVAVSAHGRGLAMQPLVGDVEELELVDARGECVRVSRERDPELFGLVCGGYGLLGVVTSVVLRLAPRRVLERRVSLIDVEELMAGFAERMGAGALYGDFQFAIDPDDARFLRRGVLSTYHPLDLGDPLDPGCRAPRPSDFDADQLELDERAWRELLFLAHTDKRAAFERYATHYLATHGQRYASDTFQLGVYVQGYHGEIDTRLGCRGSEKIAEVYVPRERLADFFAAARPVLAQADVIYGTVRLIEAETTTALPWAREPWACTVFNLHTPHTEAGQRRTRDAYRALYDLALARGGSFYLTYGRDATAEQVAAAYPQLGAFARAKAERDPGTLFTSDWWRHYAPAAELVR